MNAAELERWRIHRQHCSAAAKGEPCWGPDACKTCEQIGNVKPGKPS